MNNFKTMIGIEIHIELNTKSKMFSSSFNNFNDEPNTNLSIVDIAYPGSLPVVNKEAIVKAVKLAKSLNMTINPILQFDRKHYFYHDLPKGFQITQQFHPIGRNGFLPIYNNKKIAINRIHLEEDTAKSNYKDDKILLDYNRSGVPLIEIVTDPIIENTKMAINYIEGIQNLVKIIDISDGKLEAGSLRVDINISLMPYGSNKYGNRVEIKNINSISNIKKAIDYEINVQTQNLIKNKNILQTTKRFDEKTQSNIVMRNKDDSNDYRYLPEPNIPLIKLEKTWINKIKNPDLPWQIKDKLLKENVKEEYVKILINEPNKLNYFNQIGYPNKERLAKIFFAEIVPLAKSQNKNIKDLNILPSEIKFLIEQLDLGNISGIHLKKIIPLLINKKNVKNIINKYHYKQISDHEILEEILEKIMKHNKIFISSNIQRKERIMKFLVGKIMKETKGQANPIVANKIIKNKLSKYEKK